ncbi:MAG: glycoside hydrolase family 2 protein [Treponema sp.]|jgi:beta-mannosidase|nr:glycoside hydrolase family 2 protein [Treponema sp.]
MVIQKLHDNWKMRKAKGREWLPAKVPGSVYSDLLLNKQMEDPFWRDNEDKAFALLEDDYEYRTEFSVSPKLLSMDRILLRCEGLDTLAEVTVNNIKIASTNNMHRTWEFDVSEVLKKDKNSLVIVFHSPVNFVREAHNRNRVDGASQCLDGFPQLRKAHCMFGWDWGPRLPDAGIWRDISLVGIRSARIGNVYITQKHKKDSVELDISVEVEMTTELPSVRQNTRGQELSWKLIITDPKGKTFEYHKTARRVIIEKPELWWPNGYGSQPLYTVKLVLLSPRGKEIDTWERRIGLRTMTLRRQKDKWGESFATEVNGLAIFAMGADYIPEDNILSRTNPKRSRKLLEQCAVANFNTIRVWGGGYYPPDYFYDICDELGLVVWQDFMFACAVYDLTDEFEQNIRAEIADNVIRIRHHASLGLWCGNNEMEMFVDSGLWVDNPKQKADYIKMYEYIFPQILKELDPNTAYWPASPSSGGNFDAPNDPNRGDVHYWDVWHGNKPFTEYRKFFFRYVSEFGFQSFPALKTVESFTLPDDRNIFSYVMEKHQRNEAANGKILNYMQQTFLYPNNFDTLLYASQLLQAEAIKYGVEHFRRNRGRCMGAIYWQLNDCWPVASWSSIDYYFRWKALHYYAKRFFRPLLISCHEEGLLTQDPNANHQPQIRAAIEKSFRLNVANETGEDRKLTVAWEIRDKKAKVLKEKAIPVKASAYSSLWLDKVEVSDIKLDDEYLSYHLYDGKTIVCEGTVIFSLPKYFHWEDPLLRYTVNGDTITVKASAYAKSVEIQNAKQDLVLSDNYFDMNAGEKKVKILSGKAGKLKLRSVWDIK